MVAFSDKDGSATTANDLGRLLMQTNTDGTNYLDMVCFKYDTSGNSTRLRVGYRANGDIFTYAPTPLLSSNDTNIATTKFVTDKCGVFLGYSGIKTVSLTAGENNIDYNFSIPHSGSYIIGVEISVAPENLKSNQVYLQSVFNGVGHNFYERRHSYIVCPNTFNYDSWHGVHLLGCNVSNEQFNNTSEDFKSFKLVIFASEAITIQTECYYDRLWRNL